MKKKHLIVSTCAVALGLVSYQIGAMTSSQSSQNNRVSYVGEKESKDNKQTLKNENKTQEEINAEEGINAEQIVVKITDQGYVTSHGDHYHYYNGKVPFNSIISEELVMTDPNYVLKDSDIVNDVQDGHIIKVDGKYYLYLKDKSKATNVRTKEQIAQQQKESGSRGSDKTATSGTKGARSGATYSGGSQVAGRYTTDDGYTFNPTDVVDDMGDGFLVPHGNHFHFIPKKDLSANELATAQAYWDRKNGRGQQANTGSVRPSDAVYHQTNPAVWSGPANPIHTPNPSTPTVAGIQGNTSFAHQPMLKPAPGQTITLADLLNQLYALPSSQRHTEKDGLVFDPATISSRRDYAAIPGVVVPHGDHHHFIPYKEMTALEEQISRLYPIGGNPATIILAKGELLNPDKGNTPSHAEEVKPAQPSPSKPADTSLPFVKNGKVDFLNMELKRSAKGMDGKTYTTDDGYTFSAESIEEYDANGLMVEHGGHYHYVFYHELEESELKAAQDFINKENIRAVKPSAFTEAERAAKIQYVSIESGVPINKLIVSGDSVIIPHGDHSHTGDLKNYPTKLTPAYVKEGDDYTLLLVTLKMSYLRMQEDVLDVYRRDSTVYVMYKDGSEKTFALSDIKLPLDYEEADFSGLKTGVSEHDEKLRYIARQYKLPMRAVKYLFGDIVTVEGHGAVNLKLVDVNDEVIYSLRDKGNVAPTVTADEDDIDDVDDVESSDQPTEIINNRPKSDATTEGLIAYIGDYYGEAAESVSYIRNVGFIVTPKDAEENVVISEEAARDSYLNKTALPLLKKEEVDEEEDEAVLKAEPANASKPVSRTDLLSYLGDYYGTSAKSVSYMPKIGFVVSPAVGEENVIIDEDTLKDSYLNKTALPALSSEEASDKIEETLARPASTVRVPVTLGNSEADQPVKPTAETTVAPVPETPGKEDVASVEGDDKEGSSAVSSVPASNTVTDPWEALMIKESSAFAMDLDEFEEKLFEIAAKYGVRAESLTYHSDKNAIGLIQNGKSVLVDIVSMKAIN